MENLLTATITFHCEDDGATNIHTCNCNGNHEPQQIDYILSSDRTGCCYQVQYRGKRLPGSQLDGNVGIASTKCVLFLNVDDRRCARESRHSDEGHVALHVLTDGPARKISRREKCAGWGVHSSELIPQS